MISILPIASAVSEPQNVVTTAGPTSIKIEWDIVEDADYYGIARADTFPYFEELPVTIDKSTPYYEDTGLDPDTTYHYMVSARTNAGDYEYSQFIEVKTLEIGPLGTPVLSAYAFSTSEIELRWNAVDDADGYKIYQSYEEMGSYVEIADVSGTETEYINSGLDEGTTYYYKIAAYIGQETGDFSNIVSATTMDPVGIPILTATAVDTSSIYLEWTQVDNVYDYDLYRSLTEDGGYTKIDTVDIEEYTDTGLDHSTTYYYKVAAYDGYVMGEKSDSASATTKTPETKTSSGGGGGTGSAKVVEEVTEESEPEPIIPGFELEVENKTEAAEKVPEDVKEKSYEHLIPFSLLLLLIIILIATVMYIRERRRKQLQ
ncbi:fibronectin type III domain-containing protein [Methanimicrococcus hongohii]|nr:fibronectin type III domain-containing protein [Methanimicrococcus sp. Hf6]